MRWTTQADNVRNQVLVLEPQEPLLAACVEFWKRILADGIANAARVDWRSLNFDIVNRQVPDDSVGCLHAAFCNGRKRECDEMGQYYIRGEVFDLIQPKGESNNAFDKRQIVRLLEHYTVLKEAAGDAEVQRLLRDINAIRELFINASTAYGWFDPQIGEDSFGELPSEDMEMLTGLDPTPAHPLAHLTAGLPMDMVSELNQALIAYTPANFEVICCEIKLGTEGGKPSLFYKIECPQYPNDGTTVVNDRVHTAATRLVQKLTARGGDFPGALIRLELQKDGNWGASFSFLTAQAA